MTKYSFIKQDNVRRKVMETLGQEEEIAKVEGEICLFNQEETCGN